jgi:hypothetical protein
LDATQLDLKKTEKKIKNKKYADNHPHIFFIAIIEMNFILFEKTATDQWSIDTVKEFCNNQELTPISITEETLGDLDFISVKLEETLKEESYRLVEITNTISFIMRDDPSLDDFTVPIPTIETKLQELCI